MPEQVGTNVEKIPAKSPEVIRGPDQETPPEQEWRPDFLQSETGGGQPLTAPVPAVPVEPVPPPSLFVKEVERVLSAGLDETYRQLDPATQARFRQTGEQTAGKISELLEQTKVQTRKIVELIISWLRIIPGVNRYFLEQEAKIKTDKLLTLRRPHEPQ